MTIEQFLLRFLIALTIGALIGFEREIIGKRAGVRTIMLVCSGAALYSMVSILLPSISKEIHGEYTLRSVDISRIISNIVVGIGFLGAGVIIQNSGEIRGLTTAALIWVAAAVGVIIGIGMIWTGIIIGLIIVLALFFMRGFRVDDSISKNVKKITNRK